MVNAPRSCALQGKSRTRVDYIRDSNSQLIAQHAVGSCDREAKAYRCCTVIPGLDHWAAAVGAPGALDGLMGMDRPTVPDRSIA
jgi:hypothetical protein